MGEFALRGFLFLFGAFALLSVGLKLRSGRRAGVGVSVLTLVEAFAGVALMVSTLPGVFPIRVAGGVGMGTVVLVLVSTTAHLFQMRALSRAREESAGHRLYTSITYGLGDAAAEEGATAPEASPAGSGESTTGPWGGLAGEQEGSGGSGESPSESEAVDPITAALKGGHFDQEAFLKGTSPSDDSAREDADPSREDGDAPTGGGGVPPQGEGEPSGG